MKKIILLIFTALMMVGCWDSPDYQRIDNWQILELDSCEYIQADGYKGYVHKGNCRFCKERDSIKWEKHKKELEELIIELKK